MKVVLEDEEYIFKRQRPEVEYRLFDSKTWGYYAFSLYDTWGLSVVGYTFKIQKPLLDGTISTFSNIEGDIKADENKVHLMFPGFFLLEQFFDLRSRHV